MVIFDCGSAALRSPVEEKVELYRERTWSIRKSGCGSGRFDGIAA
jgi:hypothetical protein